MSNNINHTTHYVDPSVRPTYTPTQIQQYFDRIDLPAKYRSSPVITGPSPSPSSSAAVAAEAVAGTATEELILLNKLIKYQLAAIPFENLELHYSPHHTISLDPQHLFHKMVERGNGRGGYCMENTCLLATVLRSLGYDVMTTGARVNEAVQPVAASKSWTGPKFDGWNHMILVVTIATTRYLVDVGFGSNSPTFPVPLTSGFTALNIKPAHSLLLKQTSIADATHPTVADSQKTLSLWVYHLRFHPTQPWTPAYCFHPDIEFLPADFTTMNFFVSCSPSSWFTYHVVCLRYLLDRHAEEEEEEEEIVGDVTLFNNEIKERRHGVSRELDLELVPESSSSSPPPPPLPPLLRCEQDRIHALQKILGVKLTQPEIEGIRGMVSMLG